MSDERKVKKCPYCAEEILEEAIKCKHCKSDLPTPDSDHLHQTLTIKNKTWSLKQ